MKLNGLQYKTLIKMAKKHCRKNDDVKPALTGIMVTIRDGHATLAACDGFRAIRFIVPVDEDSPDDEFIMPILDVKCNDADMISIGHEDGRVHIFNPDTMIEQIAPAIKGDIIDIDELIKAAAEKKGNTVHLNTKFAADAFTGLEKMLSEYSLKSLIKMNVPDSGIDPIYICGESGDLTYDALLLPVRVCS